MYLNRFSVRVPEGTEKDGYVELDHNQRYTLVLRNSRHVRCDAQVSIDGHDIGTFRIAAHSNIRLERSPINDGFFTFVELGSQEARQGQLQDNAELGLVSVVFTPEIEWSPTGQVKSPWPHETVTYRCASLSEPQMSYKRAGGTVSTGHSNQQFVNVGRLTLDYAQQTTIHLRLVLRENAPNVRPLTQKETPVPPRL